ncbi:MAG: glycosyltransferase family 2 protein [Brevundimonas sp.]|uniref:glycosyltransferase family 2 protein n=1 Tax=Brevundimonas sp. TaxID=1871086 RepID=UPI0040338EDA
MAADIAVIVPTLRRPAELTRALRSVFAQTGVEARLREIVVVDNDPKATAREAVGALAAESPCPLMYVHEPQPGVATARNAALQSTDAPLIAFLDDDEAAEPHWLSALIAGQVETGADVVFGPIRGRVPEGTGWRTPYLERFFGRQGPAETGLIDHAYGCGNALMVRATALPGPAPFDTTSDQSGGEDDALFSALSARGGRFGWAADAWVDEFAPSHRATLKYALARAFAYGQSPPQIAHRAGKPASVVFWMGVGVAQTLVWGVASLALMLIASPRRAETLDRAARGLGKVLWMEGLEPHFYGARELARLDRVSPSAA